MNLYIVLLHLIIWIIWRLCLCEWNRTSAIILVWVRGNERNETRYMMIWMIFSILYRLLRVFATGLLFNAQRSVLAMCVMMSSKRWSIHIHIRNMSKRIFALYDRPRRAPFAVDKPEINLAWNLEFWSVQPFSVCVHFPIQVRIELICLFAAIEVQTNC